jgi:hypothetical protein
MPSTLPLQVRVQQLVRAAKADGVVSKAELDACLAEVDRSNDPWAPQVKAQLAGLRGVGNRNDSGFDAGAKQALTALNEPARRQVGHDAVWMAAEVYDLVDSNRTFMGGQVIDAAGATKLQQSFEGLLNRHFLTANAVDVSIDLLASLVLANPQQFTPPARTQLLTWLGVDPAVVSAMPREAPTPQQLLASAKEDRRIDAREADKLVRAFSGDGAALLGMLTDPQNPPTAAAAARFRKALGVSETAIVFQANHPGLHAALATAGADNRLDAADVQALVAASTLGQGIDVVAREDLRRFSVLYGLSRVDAGEARTALSALLARPALSRTEPTSFPVSVRTYPTNPHARNRGTIAALELQSPYVRGTMELLVSALNDPKFGVEAALKDFSVSNAGADAAFKNLRLARTGPDQFEFRASAVTTRPGQASGNGWYSASSTSTAPLRSRTFTASELQRLGTVELR